MVKAGWPDYDNLSTQNFAWHKILHTILNMRRFVQVLEVVAVSGGE
jgi:hypothetical protein